MNDEIVRCYSVLDVKQDASLREIRQAYIDLVKVWHPDRFGHDPLLQHKAQEKLKEVNAAFETIKLYATSRPESRPIDDHVRTGVEGSQVDRYIYYGLCCDEIIGTSSFRNSKWGEMKITDAWLRIMSDFVKKSRAVEYVVNGSEAFKNRADLVTHTDFTERRIYLNSSASPNLKSALVPLTMIFVRDLLNNVPKGHAEMVDKALKSAGWNGGGKYEGENYRMAELVLCDQTAEHVLERTLAKNEWSNYWSDISSHCKVKFGNAGTLKEFGILIGYHLMNVPIGRKSGG